MTYRTLLIDPPWQETMIGKFAKTRHNRATKLPYETMTVAEIQALPIPDLAADNAHIWLWCTVRSLPHGFTLLDSWGFKYHNLITWVKPSGLGAWFINRTQPLLFGYRGKIDMKTKFKPNVLFASSKRNGHSTKPDNSYELIEAVSHEPRLELFARRPRDGWTVAGNGIDGKDIKESIGELTGTEFMQRVGDEPV